MVSVQVSTGVTRIILRSETSFALASVRIVVVRESVSATCSSSWFIWLTDVGPQSQVQDINKPKAGIQKE